MESPTEECEGGKAESCYALAEHYSSEGKGEDPDGRRAAALFDKACEGGYAQGCHNVGVLYQRGEGVDKDERRAAELYDKACRGGVVADCGSP
jgi:TPR repeat protein